MININDYEQYFKTGLWHVHTNYTDGKNSVDEICQYAIKEKYNLIAFTEHVRLNLNYDFEKYLNDIEIARKKYTDLIILNGVEAKILEDGSIDCSKDILNKVDIVLLAEHGFKKDYLMNMFKFGHTLDYYVKKIIGF